MSNYEEYTILYSEVKPKELDVKAVSNYHALMLALDMYNIPEEQIIRIGLTRAQKKAAD